MKTHIEDLLLYIINKIKKTSLYILIRTKFLPFFILTILFLVNGCVKDDLDFNKLEATNWNPEIAVPLAYSSLSLEDLMKNESDSGILVVDSDKFCTLIYTGRALEMKASDMFNIPNQNFNQIVQLNDSIVTYVNTTGGIAFSYSDVADFSMQQGMKLDSALLKSGTMHLNLNSRITADVTLQISIPGATKNGIPFSTSAQLKYQGTVPVVTSIIPDLTGYHLDLTNGGTKHNQLRVDYTVSLTSTGTPLTASQKISIGLNFQGIDFEKLFGYLGQQSLLSPQDTIGISLFNSLNGLGSFTIAEPEIKIDFVNSFGLPIEAKVVEMKGVNGNLTDFVIASGIPDPLPVYSPNINQVGQVMTGTFTMDKTNSNVTNIIANQPRYIISQVQNLTNPDGNVGENFVLDTSRFAVDLEVKLPLYGTANDFLLRDTVNFNYNNLSNVESLMIRTTLENGFPIDTKFQVYFTDENFNVLDSLISGNQLLMPSAVVNLVTGKVISPTVKSTDHTLDRSRILKIMNAKKLILSAHASTINNGTTNVKIYSDYKFNVNLGAIAKVIL